MAYPKRADTIALEVEIRKFFALGLAVEEMYDRLNKRGMLKRYDSHQSATNRIRQILHACGLKLRKSRTNALPAPSPISASGSVAVGDLDCFPCKQRGHSCKAVTIIDREPWCKDCAEGRVCKATLAMQNVRKAIDLTSYA